MLSMNEKKRLSSFVFVAVIQNCGQQKQTSSLITRQAKLK
jgi:hypothetical protein